MAAKADDPRLGALISPGNQGDVVIVGFPHDEGCKRNGGRVGAALGPQAFRTHVRKVGALRNLEYEVDLSSLRIGDDGDAGSGMALEDAHDELFRKVSAILARGAVAFCIGGGNDQSYPNAAALLDSLPNGEPIGVVNIDAHLDARPLVNGQRHSGSPFRLLLEDERFRSRREHKFVEFAAQGSQCAHAHAEFVTGNGGSIVWLRRAREHPEGPVGAFRDVLTSLPQNVFFSFDIDSISSADCPGVSCPAAIGLTAQEALDMCFEAGRSGKVRVLDVSEFNPEIESYRTGRLVAFMFYYFLMGQQTRKSTA